MSDSEDGGGRSPAAAFKLLGNSTRVGILRALWDADDRPLGFSELYRRTDVGDSGQYNYHLEKLVGHFIDASPDGYDLTTAGLQVVQSVVAGTAFEAPTIAPVEVDRSCPVCAAPVRIRYDDGILSVTCTDCDGLWRDPAHHDATIGTLAFPPAALDGRSPVAVLDAGAVYLVQQAETAMAGVCPTCAGRVDSSLTLCLDHDPDGGACAACGNPFIGVLRLTCTTCKADTRAPSFALLHHHPAVEAARDRRDPDETPWDAMWRGIDWAEEIVSEDPPRIRTTIPTDEDALVFETDGDCSVSRVA